MLGFLDILILVKSGKTVFPLHREKGFNMKSNRQIENCKSRFWLFLFIKHQIT